MVAKVRVIKMDPVALITNEFKDKESTRKQHLARLKAIAKACETDDIPAVMRDPAKFYPMLVKAYPNVNTRKNNMTTLLVLFRLVPDDLKDQYVGAQTKWKNHHDNMDSLQEAKYRKNMPDDKQLLKYTPMEEIQLKYNELGRGDPHATRQDSLHFVLLSIILHSPPKRADLGSMKVYRGEDPNLKDANYLVLHTYESKLDSYMVFTTFKTSKRLVRVDQVLGRKLFNDISDSLRRWPREYLFVNKFGNPFKTNQLFTQYVIAVFDRLFGRSTGVTMIRHIFLTDKINKEYMTLEEKDELARQMLHSRGLQDRYVWDKKKVCEALRTMCGDCKN